MQLPAILIAAVAIALLVVAWCVLQIHNTDQRATPAVPDTAEGKDATVVCRRVDADASGDLVRYVTFQVRSEGRQELALPAGYDDEHLTPGNKGRLFCVGEEFVRFEQRM